MQRKIKLDLQHILLPKINSECVKDLNMIVNIPADSDFFLLQQSVKTQITREKPT
jgi:hypothetical protein